MHLLLCVPLQDDCHGCKQILRSWSALLEQLANTGKDLDKYANDQRTPTIQLHGEVWPSTSCISLQNLPLDANRHAMPHRHFCVARARARTACETPTYPTGTFSDLLIQTGICAAGTQTPSNSFAESRQHVQHADTLYDIRTNLGTQPQTSAKDTSGHGTFATHTSRTNHVIIQ